MSNEVEQLRDRILQAELIKGEELDRLIGQWRGESGAAGSAEDLIEWLAQASYLTEFQGEALLAGLVGPFMLGPYRVFERIAAGRLGTLFRAVHAEFEQPVSLKVFPKTLEKSPEKLARLGREARVSVEVDHPNVVRTFHVGQVGNITFLALEDLEGESLATLLEREGKLDYRQACGVIVQGARGLEHLHAQGIIHRDIQPANLWVQPHGHVKLMEFGAALDAMSALDTLASGEQPTMTDIIVGTFEYMAPEQAQNAHDADARSDVYSLGCTLYHCLTGQVPFPDRNPVRQMLRHANEPVRSVNEFVPDIPAALGEIVSAMLAKQPGKRYKRASDVARTLEQFTEPETLAEEENPTPSPEFLKWVQSAEGLATTGLSTATSSPECADFLNWLEDQPGSRAG